MKLVGVMGTPVLLLLLGVTAFGYAQQEQQSEKQGKPEKQAEPEKQKGKQQQQDKGKQQQQRAQRQDKGKQQQRAQQQQDKGKQQQQRAQQQQPERRQQQRRAPLSEHRKVWPQHRAHSWESEHRTWQQRGGYNGYRVPDDYFRGHYGRNHWFRVYSLPFLVVGGYPRFQYGGYWFSFVDPYPEYWGDDWYQTDDVYVEFFDDGYYLYNRRHPGRPGVAISISF